MMRVNSTERIGIYKAALIFTEDIRWVFREQPIMDVGIDALIEESIDSNPTGKFLAAQIKTGKSNFYEIEDNYTLYVSSIHYHYWINLDLPIIVIAHIPEDNKTYWENVTIETLKKTETRWKLVISKSKVLGIGSKHLLESIVKSKNKNDFITQLINGNVGIETINVMVKDAEEFATSHLDLEIMSQILNDLTQGVTKYTSKITHLVNKGLNIKDRYVKKNIEDSASLMIRSADKLNSQIELFSYKFSKGFRAIEKLAITYFELTQDYANLRALFNSIDVFTGVITETIKYTINMRDSASALPMDNDRLAKARRYWIETCNRIIAEFKEAKSMSSNLGFWIDEKIN